MIESRKLLKKQVNKSRKFVKRTDYLRKSFKNKDQKKKNKQKKSQKKSKLLGGMIEVDAEKLDKMKKSRNCKIRIVRSAMSTINSGSGYKPFGRKDELKSSLLQKINPVQDVLQFWEKTYKKNIIEDLLTNLRIPIQLIGENQEIRTYLEEQLTTVKEKLKIKDEDLNTDTLIEEIMDEIKEVVAQYVSKVTEEVKEDIRQIDSINEIFNIESLLEHLPPIQIEIVNGSNYPLYQLQNIQQIIDFLFTQSDQYMNLEYVFKPSEIDIQVDLGIEILIVPKIIEKISEIKASLTKNKAELEDLMKKKEEKEENEVNLIRLVLDNYDISQLDLPIFIYSLRPMVLGNEISELIDLKDVNGQNVIHQLNSEEDYNATPMLEAFQNLEVQVLKTNVLSQLTSFNEKQLHQLYTELGIFAASYYMNIHQSLIFLYDNFTQMNMPIHDILSSILRSIKDIFQESVDKKESLMPVELKESIRKALEQAKKEDEEDEAAPEQAPQAAP